MTTGRVEFAPDYKSDRKPKYPEMAERFKQLDRRHERLRLERAIVEAAKIYVQESRAGLMFPTGNALMDLNKAVDALIEFESLQARG